MAQSDIEQQVRLKLVQYGYAYCPGVSSSSLDLAHRNAFNTAVRQYQRNFEPELSRLTGDYHNRDAIIDGDIGPATYDLIVKGQRCGHPDYSDPTQAVENARFGDPCLESITTSHNMNLSGVSDDELDRIFVQAGRNWSDVLNVGFEYRKRDYPRTNIFAFEHPLGGSVLADQMLNVGGCSQQLRGRFDNRVWSYPLLLATCTHEWGHALGWGHVTNDRSAIMYPSIHQAGMQRGGKPNESDIRVMLSLGYQRRTSPPKPPIDPDEPKQSFTFSAPFDIKRGQKVTLSINNDGDDDRWSI